MKSIIKKIIISSLLNLILLAALVLHWIFFRPKPCKSPSLKEFEYLLAFSPSEHENLSLNLCLYKVIDYLLENGTPGRLRNAISANSTLIPSIFKDFAYSNEKKIAKNQVLDLLLAEYPTDYDYGPLDAYVREFFDLQASDTKIFPLVLQECLQRRSNFTSKRAARTLFSSYLRIFSPENGYLFRKKIFHQLKRHAIEAILKPQTICYYLLECYFEEFRISPTIMGNMFQSIYDNFGFHGYLMIPFAFSQVKVQSFPEYLYLGEDFFEAFSFHRPIERLSLLEVEHLKLFLSTNPSYENIFSPLEIKNESFQSATSSQTRRSSLPDLTQKAPFRRFGSLDETKKKKPLTKMEDKDLFDLLNSSNLLNNFLYLCVTNRLKMEFFDQDLQMDLKILLLQRPSREKCQERLTPLELIREYLVFMPKMQKYFIKMTCFQDYCPIVMIPGLESSILSLIDARNMYIIPECSMKEFKQLYRIAKENNLRNLLFALLKKALEGGKNVNLDKLFLPLPKPIINLDKFPQM